MVVASGVKATKGPWPQDMPGPKRLQRHNLGTIDVAAAYNIRDLSYSSVSLFWSNRRATRRTRQSRDDARSGTYDGRVHVALASGVFLDEALRL